MSLTDLCNKNSIEWLTGFQISDILVALYLNLRNMHDIIWLISHFLQISSIVKSSVNLKARGCQDQVE